MTRELYVGLMSGTSVDGVDAVLADFQSGRPVIVAASHLDFAPGLRAELQALQVAGSGELDRAALAANSLMDHCAEGVAAVLSEAQVDGGAIEAIGCHGQTVRHRPELGFTIQLANPARLAEITGITVVADFRSRDVAAGGQGAPLAPALHAALFALPGRHRFVLNLGGIANITSLPPDGPVTGFDVGPCNTLLDAWCERHTGRAFDRDGAWALGGKVLPSLLRALEEEPYFALPPPKSTGRDLFRLDWLLPRLRSDEAAVDVQRTLLSLTAETVAHAIARLSESSPRVEVLACGGGAKSVALMNELSLALDPRTLSTTAEACGIPVDQVEALAFAWLARQALARRPGNLPSVTGARGPRVLGAVYPA